MVQYNTKEKNSGQQLAYCQACVPDTVNVSESGTEVQKKYLLGSNSSLMSPSYQKTPGVRQPNDESPETYITRVSYSLEWFYYLFSLPKPLKCHELPEALSTVIFLLYFTSILLN